MCFLLHWILWAGGSFDIRKSAIYFGSIFVLFFFERLCYLARAAFFSAAGKKKSNPK